MKLNYFLPASVTALAFVVMGGLVGCGGGGTPASTGSPFVGSWSGTYSSSGQSGTANVEIASNGVYSGSGHDNTSGDDYTVQGNITNAGVVTGTLSEGGTTVDLHGTWSITNGHLGGAVTVVSNGVTGATNNYDMTKTSA